MSASLLSAAVLTTSSVALFAAHQVGDHWIQTNGQAMAKGGKGWTARTACARHVATLTAAKVVALALDQSWHHLFLFIAALILAGGAR